MSDLLVTALERVPPRVRRFVATIGSLVALGAVMAALTLSNPHGDHQRRPPAQRPAAAGSAHTSRRRVPPPVPTAAILQARRVAEQFLAGYLPLAYGRSSAIAIRGITPALRRQLLGQRAELTPIERHRRPRVVSLQTIGTTPAFVVATAVIDNGGLVTYRLRFTLERAAGGWAVSSVEDA